MDDRIEFKVLIIGERVLQDTVKQLLVEEKVEVARVNTPEKVEESVATAKADLIIIAFDWPQLKPFKLLTQLYASNEKREIVFVAANPSIENVIKCMQLGARDFIQLPKDGQRFQDTLKHFYGQWEKNQSGLAFRSKQSQGFGVDSIIGASPQMQHVVQLIKKVVQRRWVTVLIRGETGTGKEVVARAIHYSNAAENKPASFVEVNCSAIPENLLEAELFGHEKGAFTDAKFSKKGLFEMAEGGTLFLDEIGDMDLMLQAKLLKAIEEKRFRRLGSTTNIEVKTRIMAGTNADLEKSVNAGSFRRDLYYRLNVINIVLPPLRERGEDILLLARHFLAKYADEYDTPVRKLSPVAEAVLRDYDWPGNVRELQHTIERAVVMGDTPEIEAQEIYQALGVEKRAQATAPQGAVAWGRAIEIPPEGLSLKQGESRLIQEVLRLTKGNKSRASQILGISRPRLGRKLEEYKIQWSFNASEVH